MQRVDLHTQQQSADLVDACAGYWELRGIERASSTEMQLELEQHLRLAVHDGKSLEAVLGPNPLAFTEAWAREMHPRFRFWRDRARNSADNIPPEKENCADNPAFRHRARI